MFSGDQSQQPLKPTPRGRRNRNVVVIEKIETEGDRQLKALAEKQLATKTSLREQLLKRKAFTSPAVQEEPGLSGSFTLKEYQQITDLEERIEELRACRLTQEEIDLVISSEANTHKDQPPSKRTNYGIDPEITKIRLENIYDKIKQRDKDLEKKDEFHGARLLSRHEMDLERAISSRSKDTTSLSTMLLGTAREHKDVEEPMSDIKEVLTEIERRTSEKKSSESSSVNSSIEIDSHQREDDMGVVDEPKNECADCKQLRMKDRGVIGPLWKNELLDFENCDNCKKNLKDRWCGFREGSMETDDAVNDCADSFQRTVTIGPDESVPEEVIRRHRFSLEEIRQMPRFKEYSPGELNKTLYLKNLSPKVTEDDLATLFLRFQQPDSAKIIIKMMKGKMRGQGFVTFADTETAAQALELVNGYDFRGKPIIIQYAKKH